MNKNQFKYLIQNIVHSRFCYCAEHHAQFHAVRGDSYFKLINSRKRMDDVILDEFSLEEKNGE